VNLEDQTGDHREYHLQRELNLLESKQQDILAVNQAQEMRLRDLETKLPEERLLREYAHPQQSPQLPSPPRC
jgi:hypothetical protein